MTKKEYVIQVLTMIKDVRPIAEDLIYLVENDELKEKTVDALVNIIQYSLKQTTNEIDKQKLSKANEILQHIKLSEDRQHEMDEKDIEKLENMINNL